jgi:D-beta-D-heptose 7-phosphate kinase/D-beta-D-heptose 1-phosphate adenosyltransferase
LTTSSFDPRRKVLTLEQAVQWRRRPGQGRVVFTNGVFDLLHPGHVDILTASRALGDALVVGVNSDASVRRLKGPTRPLRTEQERALVLAALESVDVVVVFDEDTPLQLIRALTPDVLVKGGDYTVETVVGAEDVLGRGGDVIIVPLTPGHSTTGTVERMRAGGHS